MNKISLPYRHYYYLKVLSSLRRETVQESIDYLYTNIDENSDNWIDKRFSHYDKPPVEINIENIKAKVTLESLMRRIQALPQGIKPITDGPYTHDVKFEDHDKYAIIYLLGYKIYDFKNPSLYRHNFDAYQLVKDKFPFEMTMEQYDLYRRAGSQFWRLTQEREKETMPLEGEVAMDVGAYVGYRALAMHYCVGAKGKVYAIEVEDENFELLRKNAEVNGLTNFIPIQEAVDYTSRVATLYTKFKTSMSHGLRPFESIEDPGVFRVKNASHFTKEVTTLTMDSVFEKYSIDRVDTMHISVTGHEIEVLNGINSILPSLKTLRVSCPYKTNGVPNIDTAKEIMTEKGFSNFHQHGSAVIGEREN